jgi:peptidoglycan hydrolase-like protein with peptidoglycan-binding domain
MQLVGKSFSIDEFKSYVEGVTFNGWTPKFVVVHNTSSPTQALYKSWHDRKGWTIEQWLKNLASYYAGLGWNGCPHLFVAYDRICVLNDLRYRGTHSPSWNAFSWGVETVAEFESEVFSGGVKDNLIAALAILHNRIGLNPADYKLGVRGLHFHKEDIKTTHRNCPGRNLYKSLLVDDVVAYMNKGEVSHADIPEAVHTADSSILTQEEAISNTWLQEQLNISLGTHLKIDGIIGEQTKLAVRKFQYNHNLKVDGIAGPLTRLELLKINRGRLL